MNYRKLVVPAGLVVAFVLGAIWAQVQVGTPAAAEGGTKVVSLDEKQISETAVVAVTPCTYTTENEEDPFNATRVRRTYTTVTAVVVVHEDGATEVKKVEK